MKTKSDVIRSLKDPFDKFPSLLNKEIHRLDEEGFTLTSAWQENKVLRMTAINHKTKTTVLLECEDSSHPSIDNINIKKAALKSDL